MAKVDEDAVEEEDAEAEAEESEAEDKGADDGKGSKKDAEGEGDSEDDKDGDADEDADADEAEGDDKGKKSKKSDDDAEPEIPVRKVVGQQNIIARQKSTIKKLRKEDPDDADDADDEVDTTPKGVRREVAKALAPVLEALASKSDDDDLKDLYAGEPEAKKYDRSIKAYMKHPVYKGVAPSVIYHHLAWKEAQATGAKKKVVADTEAGKTKGAGSSKRPKGSKGNVPSPEELDAMSDAEFEAVQNDVLQGKYKA